MVSKAYRPSQPGVGPVDGTPHAGSHQVRENIMIELPGVALEKGQYATHSSNLSLSGIDNNRGKVVNTRLQQLGVQDSSVLEARKIIQIMARIGRRAIK